MKDILIYLSNNGFLSLFIQCAVGGFIAGLGGGLIFSILGFSAYKTFNLIERSGS